MQFVNNNQNSTNAFVSNADTNDFQFINVNTIPTIGFGNTIGQDSNKPPLQTATNRYGHKMDFNMKTAGRPTTGIPTYQGYG